MPPFDRLIPPLSIPRLFWIKTFADTSFNSVLFVNAILFEIPCNLPSYVSDYFLDHLPHSTISQNFLHVILRLYPYQSLALSPEPQHLAHVVVQHQHLTHALMPRAQSQDARSSLSITGSLAGSNASLAAVGRISGSAKAASQVEPLARSVRQKGATKGNWPLGSKVNKVGSATGCHTAGQRKITRRRLQTRLWSMKSYIRFIVTGKRIPVNWSNCAVPPKLPTHQGTVSKIQLFATMKQRATP
jgi:hypothetical protein